MKLIDSISAFGEISERDKIREMLDEALKRYKTKDSL